MREHVHKLHTVGHVLNLPIYLLYLREIRLSLQRAPAAVHCTQTQKKASEVVVQCICGQGAVTRPNVMK